MGFSRFWLAMADKEIKVHRRVICMIFPMNQRAKNDRSVRRALPVYDNVFVCLPNFCPSLCVLQTICPCLFHLETSINVCVMMLIQFHSNGGRQNLFILRKSPDQDGRHAHIWINPLKLFFSGTKWQKW